ncbi:hypothetical protein Tco_0108757 [Tanacetum coccineum]
MFNDVKLQVDYECKMAFELLRLGRIVGIKSLLKVTDAKLMLLVYKLLLLVLKVNAASTKVSTAERVSTVRERIKTEERIKIIWRSRLLTSLNLYHVILCHLAILCLYPHAHYLESLLTISLNIELLLDLLAILSLMFFEEVLGLAAVLAILVTGASQSIQHKSRKSPTAELFDVDSERISIFTVNTKEYHSDVLANITRIMSRTL